MSHDHQHLQTPPPPLSQLSQTWKIAPPLEAELASPVFPSCARYHSIAASGTGSLPRRAPDKVPPATANHPRARIRTTDPLHLPQVRHRRDEQPPALPAPPRRAPPRNPRSA